VQSVHPNPWYAIRVKSNREGVTAQGLTGKGFDVCVPRCPASSRQPSCASKQDIPLFPGYVFCRFNPLDRLPILTVPGVVHIVSFGGIPQPVEEQEMTAVLTMLQSGLQVASFPALPVGQRVLLEAGPLAGLSGVVLAHRNEERFVVSVSLLQRSIGVVVDRSWLSPVVSRTSSSIRRIA
jgi:transcription termination/antitermination protein NusG